MTQTQTYTQTQTANSNCERGQAMVEFVIILIFIAAMCSGMMYTNRLLNFQYWAQQEARYLAFEQTWAPHSARVLPLTQPVTKLNDADYFHRPGVVSGLTATKSATNAGGVSDLTFNFRESPLERPSRDAEPPILLASAKSSIWHSKSSDWLRSVADRFGVGTAYATQELVARRYRGKYEPAPRLPEVRHPVPAGVLPENPLERGMVRYLQKARFGEKVCSGLKHAMKRRGATFRLPVISDDDCAERLEYDFGVHVAQNVDFKEFFREYGVQLSGNWDQGEALEKTVELEVASQFYSFFDTLVSIASSELPVAGYIGTQRALIALDMLDAKILDMITDFRYIGSSYAIGAIVEKLAEMEIRDIFNRNSQSEQDFEESVTDILHVDASEFIPLIGNGFLLNPLYLPVPPTLEPAMAGMFSGLMKNALWKDEDKWDEQIDDSNKLAKVTYEADNGLFSAAVRRFNTTGKKLTSKFYLVTQEWHIQRRETATGPYRELGGQEDHITDVSDEGIMRRRVAGLWLFPKKPSEFFEGISDIDGLGFLGPIADALEPLDEVFSAMGEIMTNSDIREFLDTLRDIPGLGSMVPDIPEWPAVRPAAYPGTKEIVDDKMVLDETRTFQDYIDEQDHNPPPKPDFHEAN